MASNRANAISAIARAVLPMAGRALATLDAAAVKAEKLAADTWLFGQNQEIEYARKPPKTVLSQIQPVNISSWDLGTVKAALEDHELGFFQQSTSLADAMGRDDRITACRNTRVRALAGKSGVGFSLTPSTKGKPATARDLAREVTELWSYSCSEAALTKILDDAVMLGVAFARIHWTKIDGRMVPRLEPWFPQTIYYDWSIRKFRAIGLEGQVVVDPGSAEWLIFEPGAGRSWMSGGIRGLGVPWMYRQFSQNDWSRFCEKHGIPIIAISEPAGHQWSQQKQSFYGSMRRIGREGVIRLPKNADGYGFDVKYVEPRDRSWEAFKEFCIRLDTNIAVMLLGQNLTTEVQGGSYAAAAAHEKVRLDYLDADAETLSTALREQVWKPYVRFNHGADLEELAPWPTWATRPPEDRKARIDIVKTYVDIGKALADGAASQAPVDMRALALELDLKITKVQPEPAQPEETDEEAPEEAEEEATEPVDDEEVAEEQPVDDEETEAPAEEDEPVDSGVAAAEERLAKANRRLAEITGEPSDEGEGDEDTDEGDDEEEEPAKATALAVYTPGLPFPIRTFASGRIRVIVDRPRGYVQRGVASDGALWSRTYTVDYGYLHGTLGGDGDELDVYCGNAVDSPTCFVAAQVDDAGNPDEFKLGLGFNTADEFRATFIAHTPERFLAGIFAMPVEVVVALRGESPVARLTLLSMRAQESIESRHDDVVLLSQYDADNQRCGLQPEAIASTHSAWASGVNMTSVALRTSAFTMDEANAAIAARTLRLMSAAPAWDAADAEAAARDAKRRERFRGAARTPQRDILLRALGHDVEAATALATGGDDELANAAERLARAMAKLKKLERTKPNA